MLKQTDDLSGHSALGGYATIVLLTICIIMAVSGSFSTDDILYEGPFAHLAPDYIKLASSVHHMTENALFAVIVLHLLALFVYFWRLKKNLVPAMITGSRPKAAGESRKLMFEKVIHIFLPSNGDGHFLFLGGHS